MITAKGRPSFGDRFAMPVGGVMLILWVLGMVIIDGAPGWLHFFLIFGVFFLIWGIVARDRVRLPEQKNTRGT